MKYTREQIVANRKKWIKALRSGKYKQTSARLRDKEGFCCLGVACDLAFKDLNKKPVYEPCWGRYTYDNSSGVLPITVQEWLGVKDENINTNRGYATEMNDDKKYNFKKIADIMEDHFFRKR